MIARTHSSILRMFIAGALLFGALMILGLAAFPPQSAQAAPKNPKPQTWKLDCGDIGASYLACNSNGGFIKIGDNISGKASTKYGYCLFLMTVTKLPTFDGTVYVGSKVFGGLVEGEVVAAKGYFNPGDPDPCEELNIAKGQIIQFIYFFDVPKKKGGKKK